MKLVHTSTLLSLISLVLLSGCMNDEESAFEQQVRAENEIIENYLTENNIQAERLNSGIHFEVLQENPSGTIVKNESIVAIRYNLRTLEGKAIDSLPDSLASLRFFHAQDFPNALFPRGINIGVGHMREGEQYRFYIPSYQAFDAYSFGQYLPRNSMLIAEVTLEKIEEKESVKVEEMKTITEYIEAHNLTNAKELSSGIFFELLKEGDGEKPETGALVKVNFKGQYLDGEVFDESEKDKPYEFFVGKNRVIPGFELGVEAMNEGGKARIFVPSHLGFGEGVQVIPPAIRKDFLTEYNVRNLRPYEPMIFELELVDIQ
ncbi:MAG: FKBP-type peptidyl-prolyl cis-trans isomerase [Bacteroidota bacterium]